MEYSEVLAARHSVRKFKDTPVEREILDALVQEALLAPSSKNSRSSGFMIVEDPDTLAAMSQMRDYGAKPLAEAAAAIIVLGDTSKTDLWVENCSISATYLLLSAVNRGLGGCWIHINGRPRFKEDPSKGSAEGYLRELLGLKDNIRPLCAIALGYEDK